MAQKRFIKNSVLPGTAQELEDHYAARASQRNMGRPPLKQRMEVVDRALAAGRAISERNAKASVVSSGKRKTDDRKIGRAAYEDIERRREQYISDIENGKNPPKQDFPRPINKPSKRASTYREEFAKSNRNVRNANNRRTDGGGNRSTRAAIERAFAEAKRKKKW